MRVPIHSRSLVMQSDGIETVPADLYNLQDCLRVCEGVDYVIHAAGAVAAAGHGKAHVEFDATKPTTIPVRIVDASKAAQLLDFKTEATLEEGVRDTVKWYQEYVSH